MFSIRRRRTNPRTTRIRRIEKLEARELLAFDVGDAPPPFPTTIDDDGPLHVARGPLLGFVREGILDLEEDLLQLDSDDQSDDGVSFGELRVGQPDAGVRVQVSNAPSGTRLDAWIDFNGDGNWGGKNDRIASHWPVVEGENEIRFSVPASVSRGILTAQRDSRNVISIRTARHSGITESCRYRSST